MSTWDSTSPVAAEQLAASAFSLINPNNSADDSGTGFCFLEQTASPADYAQALDDCNDQGARVCSLSEIYKACRAGKVSDNTSLMSADLTYNTTVSYIQFTDIGSNDCSDSNFTLTDKDIGLSSGFACCINP